MLLSFLFAAWMVSSYFLVNVPLLLKSVILISKEQRKERDLSLPKLAQKENQSVL
jgi:hypothetical protein